MRGASTGDCYVRLAAKLSQVSSFGTPSRPDALLFVDLVADGGGLREAVRRIRDLPYGHFLGVSRVLIRLPLALQDGDDSQEAAASSVLAELEDLVPRIAPSVTGYGVLVQRFGSPALIRGSIAAERHPEMIVRARAVELSALLESNHSVWAPEDYHFRLPNGLHATSFVRLADAFTSPRDVEVLVSWLLPALRDGRGLVLDNRSLTPIALCVQRYFDLTGARLGPVTFLEQYLDTQFDVESAVRESASLGGGVLGVLSVSSAGNTKDRMLAAFDRAAQPEWSLHVMLDRSLASDSPTLSAGGSDGVSTWLGFEHTSTTAASPDQCEACLSQKNRRVVAIDPRFFDGMILPNPTLTMLQPVSAQEAAPFWEACDEAGAVALEHKPATATSARRSRVDDKSGRMAVFVSLDRLFASAGFADRARVATQTLLARGEKAGESIRPAKALAAIDTVVLSESDLPEDTRGSNFREVVSAILETLPGAPTWDSVQVVDHEADPSAWGSPQVEAIRSSQRLLVLGAGSVSGYSMQRLLVGCQEHLRGAHDPEPLTGLVVHARPSTGREWTTLQNSFNRQLYALYSTLLPTTSPLKRELDTVAAMRGTLASLERPWKREIEQFLEDRTRVCSGYDGEVSLDRPAEYSALLWGLPPNLEERARIRQHSLFGHKLGPSAYFGAVGSAVHRERERIADVRGPVWQLFEVPALLRSYYDPLLLATMLRWMHPAEIWWGDQAVGSITALIDRCTEEDEAVLVPELLLSASHGKIPKEAADVAENRALQLLSTPPAVFGAREVVALGAGLLAWRSERRSRNRRSSGPIDSLPPWPSSVDIEAR